MIYFILEVTMRYIILIDIIFVDVMIIYWLMTDDLMVMRFVICWFWGIFSFLNIYWLWCTVHWFRLWSKVWFVLNNLRFWLINRFDMSRLVLCMRYWLDI